MPVSFSSVVQFNFLSFIFAEESEKPADLNQPIVFKSKKSENRTTSSIEPNVDKEKKRSRPEVNKSKLSFPDEEDEEDEE